MWPFHPEMRGAGAFVRYFKCTPEVQKNSQGRHREHPRGTKNSKGRQRGHPSGRGNTREHPSRVLTLSQRLIINYSYSFESDNVNQECVRCVILKRRAQEFFKATQEVPQRCSRSPSRAPWMHLSNIWEIQSGGIATGA